MSLRITGGSLRGRKLSTPKHSGVRPTAARVRESLSSILGQQLSGRVVLDLFAGVGTLGIEAVSRGAERAVFVEADSGHGRILEQNLELLGDRAELLRMKADRALSLLEKRGSRFDLVFLDPPYGKGLGEQALNILGHAGGTLLLDGAQIVIESDSRDGELVPPPGFREQRSRAYGQTRLTVLRFGRTDG